jgi:hypothetical protein
MKLDIQIRDLWETTDYISYRSTKNGNNVYKYNWGYLSYEIGDIREMDVENFYAVALKVKYNVSKNDNNFTSENCTAIYNNETKTFNVVEKPSVDDPMGITALKLINKNTLQVEYVDSAVNGGPGFVYVANLYKKFKEKK